MQEIRRLDVLSDWVILTPAGRITPVEAMAARTLRAKREEILKAIRDQSSAQ